EGCNYAKPGDYHASSISYQWNNGACRVISYTTNGCSGRAHSSYVSSQFYGERKLSCGEIGVVLTERESICEKTRGREMATAHGRGFPFRNAGQKGVSWHKIPED